MSAVAWGLCQRSVSHPCSSNPVHGELVTTLRLASGTERGNGTAKHSGRGRHGWAAVGQIVLPECGPLHCGLTSHHCGSLRGQIAAAVCPPDIALPHIQSGKLRALVTTGPQRSAQLPEVPTINEAGYPSLEFVDWFGIFLPAGTPAEEIARLIQQSRCALQESVVGPPLPTCAVHKVVSYLRYCGRAGRTAATYAPGETLCS
jgi:Tripartite tricarboxylate transporter family receptor